MHSVSLERPDATLVGTQVGEGPRVLLLHAGGERRSVWNPIASLLAGAGYRCVAYDQRGHGESGAAGADLPDTFAGDLEAMIDSATGRVTVVGASLGGLAAMLAVQRPHVAERLASVVLVDVVPFLEPDRVRDHLNAIAPGAGESPRVRAFLDARRRIAATTTALASLPTLLVRGGASEACSEAAIRRLAEEVPDVETVTVTGAGHLVARDDPNTLAELLLRHFQTPPVRRRRIDALLDAGAVERIEHPGGTLRDHLGRTAATLAAWGAADWLVDAGALHAAYGTDEFPAGIPGLEPPALIAAAGVRTEQLVVLYGRCDRALSYPTLATDAPVVVDRFSGARQPLTDGEARAFAELTAANELDVIAHNPVIAAEHGLELKALMGRWKPLLSASAQAAWGVA